MWIPSSDIYMPICNISKGINLHGSWGTIPILTAVSEFEMTGVSLIYIKKSLEHLRKRSNIAVVLLFFVSSIHLGIRKVIEVNLV